MAQHNSSYIIWRLYRCLIICLIISAIASIPAYAGEYHNPKERTTTQIETLACAQCHTMHGSQGAGAGSGSLIYDGTPAIFPKLLRQANVLLLCLFCHGDVSPGVIDGNASFPNGSRTPPKIWNTTTAIPPYIPSAGDFADGGSVNEANRHSIGSTAFAVSGPPGNNTTTWNNGTTNSVVGKFGDTFVCLYCHDQHGNRNYRNFRYDTGNPANDNPTNGVKVSYRMKNDVTGKCSDGADAPCDVENDSDTDFATLGNRAKYQRKNVVFNKAAGVDYNRVSEWCGKCHTRFFGISGSPTNEATGPYLGGTTGAGVGPGDTNTGTPGTPWKRHPVGDDSLERGVTNMHVDFSVSPYINKDLVRVVDPADATTGIAGNNSQPFCLSCHYSHGGGNPNRAGTATLDHSNLVMLSDTGALNLQGATGATYRMRNTCLQCHNQ